LISISCRSSSRSFAIDSPVRHLVVTCQNKSSKFCYWSTVFSLLLVNSHAKRTRYFTACLRLPVRKRTQTGTFTHRQAEGAEEEKRGKMFLFLYPLRTPATSACLRAARRQAVKVLDFILRASLCSWRFNPVWFRLRWVGRGLSEIPSVLRHV